MSHSKIPTKTKFALRQEPREQTCDLFDKASFRPLSSCSSSAWIVSASPRPFRPAISCLGASRATVVEARGWFRDAGVRETCAPQQTKCTSIWMILHCGLINDADTREPYRKKLVHGGMVYRTFVRSGPKTLLGRIHVTA
jgi:hypothetical protein